MNLLHGVGDFFALDIGTNSMRIVQLARSGKGGWVLQKYAYVPIDAKLTKDISELGKRRLGEAVLGAVEQAGIKTKNVAIGLPAQKTFTSVAEVDNLPEKDLRKTVKYEIDKYVPMAMSDAKADYIILGESPNDPAKAEVLISSTAKEYAETEMEIFEKVGLNIVAMEPEPLAMARSLMPVGALDAQLIVDLGENSTDIVVTFKNAVRLVRSIPEGFAALVKTVSTSLNVQETQARQFIMKFGLAQDKVEGQVFKVLDGMLENYASELAKSIRFFQTKYVNGKVGGIVLSGLAGVIPFIAEYIEAKTRISTVQGNPWQLVQVTPEQQQALSSVASEFAVAIGLAERSND